MPYTEFNDQNKLERQAEARGGDEDSEKEEEEEENVLRIPMER